MINLGNTTFSFNGNHLLMFKIQSHMVWILNRTFTYTFAGWSNVDQNYSLVSRILSCTPPWVFPWATPLGFSRSVRLTLADSVTSALLRPPLWTIPSSIVPFYRYLLGPPLKDFSLVISFSGSSLILASHVGD